MASQEQANFQNKADTNNKRDLVRLLGFLLDKQQYALHLDVVERAVRAVEITPLPKAPDIVLGVVNIRGFVIPVFNIRKRFRLPEKEMDLSDQLIVARTSKRPVALLADTVTGVVERPEEQITAAGKIVPGMEYVEGVIKLEDGLLFIHDLDKFLSIEEKATLEQAME